MHSLSHSLSLSFAPSPLLRLNPDKEMSHHHHHRPPPLPPTILLFSLLPTILHALPVLPNPDPSSIQSFHPNPTPPVTIPSFPEQSAVAGCPLNLSDQLFSAVRSSCIPHSGKLSRSKCCPVLAAWLYSAYADTALGMARATATTSSEMPVLPDDSETCVDGVEKAMRSKGVELLRPNETCGVVYCYCGIRLHPLNCPQAFHLSINGNLVGDHRVSRLEADCLSTKTNHSGIANGNHGLARCSKCLNSLYELKKSENGNGNGNATVLEGRTRKMRGRECELMGLTWLLNKDRDAYMSTVTAVMRALMLNPGDADPQSCSLSSNGMPLAVDSVEINDQSSSVSVTLHFWPYLNLFFLFLLIMYNNV